MNKRSFCLFFLIIYRFNCLGQAYDLNSFFSSQNAITFLNYDSSNFILNEIKSYNDLHNTINKEFPFTLNDFDSIHSLTPFNIELPLPNLHHEIPYYDTVLQETKGFFLLNNKIANWYAYYCKTTNDTSTAFIIIPGFGYHESWQIASGDTNDYHNKIMSIRSKCLQHGDVYVYSKPNEDFRSIWKNIYNTNQYFKLDYDVLTPFTDLNGHHWAITMYIECIALVKTLKLKYNKVIVLGLSNGGFPALVATLEGGADGVNCASGLSASSYDGFPVNNNQNPLFHTLLQRYSLDSIHQKIRNSNSYFLFSYGDSDCCTNAYEHYSHSLEDTLQSPTPSCHVDFTYNFVGHRFPIEYLDTFINKVKTDTCTNTFALDVPIINSSKSKLVVFPNPIKNKQNVTIAADEPIRELNLYSLQGELIFNKKNLNTNTYQLNFKNLSPANYLLVIRTESKTSSELISLIK